MIEWAAMELHKEKSYSMKWVISHALTSHLIPFFNFIQDGVGRGRKKQDISSQMNWGSNSGPVTD